MEMALGALILLPFFIGILPDFAMYVCDILWAGLLVLFLSKRVIEGVKAWATIGADRAMNTVNTKPKQV